VERRARKPHVTPPKKAAVARKAAEEEEAKDADASDEVPSPSIHHGLEEPPVLVSEEMRQAVVEFLGSQECALFSEVRASFPPAIYFPPQPSALECVLHL
jgi:hypothetical protein